MNISDDPDIRTFSSAVFAIATAPNSLEFCVGSGSERALSLWNVGSPAATRVFPDDRSAEVHCLCYSPDGSSIVSGLSDNSVVVRSVNSSRERPIVFVGHSNSVCGLSISPDGRFVASASLDWTVKIWDIRSEKCTLTFNGFGDWAKSVLFSRDGRAVFSGSADKSIVKFETTTGRVIWTAEEHNYGVHCLAMSVAGDVLASGSKDSTIRIWLSDYGKCIAVCRGHTDMVSAVDFCPSNDRILGSVSMDRTFRLWNTLDGTCLFVKENVHNGHIWCFRFTFDGQYAISASNDKTLKVWRVNGITGGREKAVGSSSPPPAAPKKGKGRQR